MSPCLNSRHFTVTRDFLCGIQSQGLQQELCVRNAIAAGSEEQQNLAPYAEELKGKLDPLAQDLKTQLTTLWDSFTKNSQ